MGNEPDGKQGTLSSAIKRLENTGLVRLLRWLRYEADAGRVDEDGYVDEDRAAAYVDQSSIGDQAWDPGCALVACAIGVWAGTEEDGTHYPTYCLTDAGRALLELLDACGGAVEQTREERAKG